MIPGILLSIGIAILLCWHAVRTGRDSFWLWIIIMFQPLGGLVYFALNVVPDLFGGTTAQRVSRAARETLDPHREYREAKAACEETPTVRNQSRLAHAAAHLGHHAEAEALYREAAQGVHADDPALLLGLAKALLELSRPADALAVLEKLGDDEAHGRTPPAALALAMAWRNALVALVLSSATAPKSRMSNTPAGMRGRVGCGMGNGGFTASMASVGM